MKKEKEKTFHLETCVIYHFKYSLECVNFMSLYWNAEMSFRIKPYFFVEELSNKKIRWKNVKICEFHFLTSDSLYT